MSILGGGGGGEAVPDYNNNYTHTHTTQRRTNPPIGPITQPFPPNNAQSVSFTAKSGQSSALCNHRPAHSRIPFAQLFSSSLFSAPTRRRWSHPFLTTDRERNRVNCRTPSSVFSPPPPICCDVLNRPSDEFATSFSPVSLSLKQAVVLVCSVCTQTEK